MKKTITALCLGCVLGCTAATGAADSPRPPPLPLDKLKVGDWARWDGTQLSLTETLSVARILIVKEAGDDYVLIDHIFRNLTRDQTPEAERTIWNSLLDERVERRFSLKSPPEAWQIFTDMMECDDSNSRAPADLVAGPAPADAKVAKPKAETIEIMGREWNAGFYEYRIQPAEYDEKYEDEDLSFVMHEWRGEAPLGILRCEAGGGFSNLFSTDTEEVADLRAEMLAAGSSEEEIVAEIAAMDTFFQLLVDESVSMAEIVALVNTMKSTQIEREKKGEDWDEAEWLDELSALRELTVIAKNIKFFSLTLTAHGDAANIPEF